MRLPAEIPLTQGRYALVDEEDFDLLMQYNWQCRDGYAKRCNYPSKKPISMQCQLMNPVDGEPAPRIVHPTVFGKRSHKDVRVT